MAKDKKSFLFYTDWKDLFLELRDIDAGKLIKHICKYVNDESPPDPSGVVKMAFIPIKSQLKRDLKKWEEKSEKNSKIAKNRWDEVRKNANASERIKENTKNADTDTVNVTVKDKVIVKEKKKEIVPFVFLTDEEYLKIEQAFPLCHHDAMIVLSNYKQSSGKKYKSDYHALIGWVKDKFEKEKSSGKKESLVENLKRVGGSIGL